MARRSVQRQHLLDLLREGHDHPSAVQLLERYRSRGGVASLSSLYRNLEALVAEGRVRKIRLEAGAERFDANPFPHYHVVCQRCSRLWDVPVGREDQCRFTLPEGFRPEAYEITVRGTCAACAASLHPFLDKEV